MDNALMTMYELAIHPFAALAEDAANVSPGPSGVARFERCEVCFDPGWDPLDPPPPDQPDASGAVA